MLKRLFFIPILSIRANELRCSTVKNLFQGIGVFSEGSTCCGSERNTTNLPLLYSVKTSLDTLANVRHPVMTTPLEPEEGMHGFRTYKGAVHGDVIYYPMAPQASLESLMDTAAVVAYDTSTDSIKWTLTYGDAFDITDNSTVVSVRNTPFVDAEHGLIWINDCRDAHTVVAINMSDGTVERRIQPTMPQPLNPGPRVRTGVVVEYENGEPMIYLGWTQLFVGGYVYINYAGIFGKSNTAVPGTFFGPNGYMAKYDKNGDIMWAVDTMPEAIQPRGIIPDECFRPGQDEVKVLNQLVDGYLFEDTATYRTSGRRTLWDKDAKVAHSFDFAAGTTFNASVIYTSVDGVSVNGSSLVWDEKHSNTWGSSDTASYIGKELKHGFDLTNKTWEAYHLNYFGGSVWAQGIYIDGDRVVFGTGNPSHVAYDEAMMYTESNMIYDTQEFATGQIELGDIKRKYLERDAYPKSARGRRAWFNSVVALDKATGAPKGVIQTTPYDTAHNGFWGGFINPYNSALVGQPHGQPYATPESSDMDIGVGTVPLADGKLGICNKASYCYVFKTDAGSIEPAQPGDTFMMQGVKTEGFQYMNVTHPTHVSLWSWVGGVNYGISSDGQKMYGVMRNDGGAGEHLTQPNLVRPKIGQFYVKYGVPYALALNSEGRVTWVTPLYDATGVGATEVKDGRVYITMFRDLDFHTVPEISTDDRGITDRPGVVYELDAATGDILHIGHSVAGAMWPPQVISRDKVYAFNGCSRSYTAVHGLTNILEKYDFSEVKR